MSGYRYPKQPITRQHKQRGGQGYLKYRPCLRLEFHHRCVYCRTAEVEVKPVQRYGGFEIDHFRPQVSFPRLVARYSNLYWACPECNRIKSQKWPTSAEVKRGYRFVDPCVDAPSEHLEIRGDHLVAKTPAGAYTIDEIQLNSVVHVRRRADRQIMLKRLMLLVRLAEDDDSRGAALAMLEELKASPWDADDPRCLCSSITPLEPE
jgi:hypothetical protein